MGRNGSALDVAPSVPARSSDRPLDLAVVGHVNLDHLLGVDQLPRPDRTVPVRSRHTELGGTAANLALAAAGWGVRTALVSRVGTDFPPEFTDRLAAAHIDLTGLERLEGGSSSACVIVHDARGGQMTFIDQGPMEDARRAVLPGAVLGKAAWVHLATGDPRFLRRVEVWARRHGVRVAIDPAQEVYYRWSRATLGPYARDAEILFGNEHEIRHVARVLGHGATRELTDIVPLVVMTRGPRGVRAFHRGGTVDVPAAPVRGLTDPTGAGDAFRGGFYAAWFAGVPLRECLRAGGRSAAHWLERRNHPTRRPAPSRGRP